MACRQEPANKEKKMRGLLMALLLLPAFASAEYVQGYTRKDGTYVQGYNRSSGDSYKYNNYGSQGNTNPYPGQRGTERHEFSSKPSYNKSNPMCGYYCQQEED